MKNKTPHTNIKIIEVGTKVNCDVCNEEYDNKPDSGGFLFGSNAYCPKCAEQYLPSIQKEGEENMITARCPEGMSFYDWVLSLRGGDNTIKIITRDFV